MKILDALFLSAIMLMLPVQAYASSLGDMRTSLIEGDVQIKIPETGEWAPLAVNTPLLEGDELWVPEGARAELQLNTNTYVRLDQFTAFQILRLERDAPQFSVSQGHAYVYYNAPRRGVIQVDTPAASIRCYENSVFRIDIPDQFTDVSVYKGSVYVENDRGRTRLSADYTLSLGPGTDAELAPMGPPDEWEVWNKERNRSVFARKVSYRYLPAELRPYAYDFDSGGRWVSVPQYGYCWTPTVDITVGWAPYRHGRWTWVGGEYVWISYEPWGWAPYHYGRWAFVARYGWCWVPPVAGQVYWAPGYVAWVSTPGYVAWVPLAPGDVYYGRGYYGRNSVNITNINITEVHVTKVYKNVHVNNAITVVSEKGFISGRHSAVRTDEIRNIRQNRFLTRRIDVAGPGIKPRDASYFTAVKDIPRAKLPPREVRDIRVKELRAGRPLTREQDRSVFKPRSKPEDLRVRTIPTPRGPSERTKGREQIRPPERGRPAVSPRATEEEKIRRERPAIAPEGRGGSEIRSVPEGRRERRETPVVTPQRREGTGATVAPKGAREQRERPMVAPQQRGGGVPSTSRIIREERAKPAVTPDGSRGRRVAPEKEQRKATSPVKTDDENKGQQPFEERRQRGKREQSPGG